jgi:hypothetical protein
MERMTAQKQKLIFRRMLPSFDIQSLVFFRPYVAKNEEAYGIGIEADATLCMLFLCAAGRPASSYKTTLKPAGPCANKLRRTPVFTSRWLVHKRLVPFQLFRPNDAPSI